MFLPAWKAQYAFLFRARFRDVAQSDTRACCNNVINGGDDAKKNILWETGFSGSSPHVPRQSPSFPCCLLASLDSHCFRSPPKLSFACTVPAHGMPPRTSLSRRVVLALCTACLAVAVSDAVAAEPLVRPPTPPCHNVTGTCLPHGFVCASGEVIPHAQRCNEVEDCTDGTDEFLCHDPEPTRPMHTRSAEERHRGMHAQYVNDVPSCVECNCEVNALTIRLGDPWIEYAKVAPLDLTMMTGAGAYGAMPCDPTCTWMYELAFFKKNNACRGWLCCVRQRRCAACWPLNPCTGRDVATFRCYA